VLETGIATAMRWLPARWRDPRRRLSNMSRMRRALAASAFLHRISSSLRQQNRMVCHPSVLPLRFQAGSTLLSLAEAACPTRRAFLNKAIKTNRTIVRSSHSGRSRYSRKMV
jgi:hypothetical protein